MLAPTGSQGQFGYRFSKGISTHGEDIWQGPVNKFGRFISMEGIDESIVFEPNENMDPSNQSLGGDPARLIVVPKVRLNPDVDTIAPLVVHHCGKDPVITTPAGGVDSRQWVVTPYEYGDAANADYLDSLILEGYDGQECSLADGGRLQDLGIKIAANKNVTAELGFMACGSTREADGEVENLAGTYSAIPLVKGERAEALEGEILLAKITAGAAGGYDATVKWTIDAYAGATTHQIKFDRWYRLVLDDGTLGGVSRDHDLWFCFPSTDPATVLTADDEFSFAASRTPATPSYSTRRRLVANGLELTVAGEEYFIKTGDIKIINPMSPNYVAGRIHAMGIDRGGKWAVDVSFDRSRNDTDFVKLLRRAKTFALSAKMYGLPIEGNILDLWQVDINCKVSNVQRGVPDPNTLQEKVSIMGERSGSTPIVTHTFRTSLTALAA